MASVKKQPNGKWRARYRDPANREHARHFTTKRDAEDWLDTIRAELAQGTYVDPVAARETFGQYAKRWGAIQVHRPATARTVERVLRLHILPTFEHRPIRQVRKSEVQAWVKSRESVLAPSTLAMAFDWLRNIFRAAQDDGLVIASRNPCRGVKLPTVDRVQVVPLTVEQVNALAEAMPARYRAAVLVGAATGLRQSELFALTVDRVDFLRRTIRVDRQLGQDAVRGFVPCKTEASVRTVPITTSTAQVLAQQLERYSPGDDGLIFTCPHRGAVRRARAGYLWRGAAEKVGVSEHGWHALRHFYASMLIRYGESVTTVQHRLGHATAAETLNVYAHLWGDSDDSTRAAIDAAFAPADDSRGLSADSGA